MRMSIKRKNIKSGGERKRDRNQQKKIGNRWLLKQTTLDKF